ncbi:hypothetical protein [Magnetospirillum sulfuroxidans]|uniref:Uncharacterized protein n=1 Tax=Magnetospirillum sulfuroxidans TaxID=611300 RepID=A0ABS5IFI7_9PROT|nr:hypothetical protein [Magnetospirillum sulfuroxidans]MBR9972927.1 hypothetical protein [Magnetospirillum sulfuroxidans]
MRITLITFIFLALTHTATADTSHTATPKAGGCSLPEYDDYVRKIVNAAVKEEKDHNNTTRMNEIRMLAKRSISFNVIPTPTRASFGNFFILDLRIENNLPVSIGIDPKKISIKLPVNSTTNNNEEFISTKGVQHSANSDNTCASDDTEQIILSTGHDAVLRWKCSPKISIPEYLIDRPEMEQSVKIDGTVNMLTNESNATDSQNNKENTKNPLTYPFSFTHKIKFETPLVWTFVGAIFGGILSIVWQFFHEDIEHKIENLPLNKRIAMSIARRKIGYYVLKKFVVLSFAVLLVLLIDMSSSGFLFVNIKLFGIFGAALAGFLICQMLRDSNLEKVKHLFGGN